MREMMHREVKYLANVYTARRWVLAHQDPAGEALVVDVLPGTRRREEGGGRGPRSKVRGSRLAREANQTEEGPPEVWRRPTERASWSQAGRRCGRC